MLTEEHRVAGQEFNAASRSDRTACNALLPSILARVPWVRAFWRSGFIIAHDTLAATAAMAAAFWLRYAIAGTGIPDLETTLSYSALFGFIAFLVVCVLRIHRDVWQFTSLRSLDRVAQVALLTPLFFSLTAFLLTRTENVPRSVPVIAGVILAGLLILSRILRRMQSEGSFALSTPADRIPIILIGAGSQADSFISAMRRNRDAPYRVEGLLSQSAELKGCRIRGVPVLGMPRELASVVRDLRTKGHKRLRRQVQRVILTGDESYRQIAAKIGEDCDRLGLSIARLPHAAELRESLGSETEVRPVAIEDLLTRPQVRIDRSRMNSLIRGRRIMVTGAGGSIGAELVRQIAEYKPAKLILLDHAEFNLYEIDRALANQAANVPRRAGLCDVRDRRRVERWFSDERPDVVFHAAALKHVPLIEDHASDGILTNVIGTRNVAEAARKFGAAVMVLISTDKAVNPSSVMGATKRAAESYCQALEAEFDLSAGGTRFVTVRFGNVLGSAGSVVPLFQEQLARGGPLTVTHPEICRYFMTIPEAVQLIVQASASAETEQTGIGQIFVLDMGDPIKVADLARQMIRLSGKRPDVDVKLSYVGLRPGEKLFEELAYSVEELAPSPVPGVLLAHPAHGNLDHLAPAIAALEKAARAYDDDRSVELLCDLVPEFLSPAKSRERVEFSSAAEKRGNFGVAAE